MKKSKPARARKIDMGQPLKAVPLSTGLNVGQQDKMVEMKDQLKTVGNQKDRGRLELDRLKQQLKGADGVPNAEMQRALAKLRERFGDEAYREGIRELNLTFAGIPGAPLLRNQGPGGQI